MMTASQELSVQNPRVRDAAKLSQRKFRRQTGCLLLEGARLVLDALDAGVEMREMFCTSAFMHSAGGRQIEARSKGSLTVITEQAAAKLSETRTPQGVFAVAAFAPARLEAVPLGVNALALVAAGIADPGNLGTMVRSAAALGTSCVVVPDDSCDVLNPKAVRAAMGAIFRVPVVADLSLADAVRGLKSRGLRIVAAAARGGRPPWKLDLAVPTALLVGSEAEGLPAEALGAADELATIPMHHGAESLNAAACAAALLYEAARQQVCTGVSGNS